MLGILGAVRLHDLLEMNWLGSSVVDLEGDEDFHLLGGWGGNSSDSGGEGQKGEDGGELHDCGRNFSCLGGGDWN